MSKPRDAIGNPLSVHDIVRPAETQHPHGDVRALLGGGDVAVAWPAGYWTRTPAKSLRRLNQHAITPTPLSTGVA